MIIKDIIVKLREKDRLISSPPLSSPFHSISSYRSIDLRGIFIFLKVSLAVLYLFSSRPVMDERKAPHSWEEEDLGRQGVICARESILIG